MSLGTVLITGAGGMLARALLRELSISGADIIGLSKPELDVTDPVRVREIVRDLRPHLVIQCAAFTRVDDAESQANRAFQVNAEAVRHVAEACTAVGARLVYPSTDYVFGGDAASPFPPDHPVSPINAYGRSKAAGEEAACTAPDHLIVRTGWLYGAGGRNFVGGVLDRLRKGERLRIVNDQWGSPTWTGDLARTIVKLLTCDAPPGVFHATNSGVTNWYHFACEVAVLARIPAAIEPCSSAEYAALAMRPSYSVLDCSATERLVGPMRDWRAALAQAIDARDY